MPDININEYALSLYARIKEARVLTRVEMELDGWRPSPNMCHHNASELYLKDNSYIPVRGWLFFDIKALNLVKFVSHSAVKLPNGEIVDITPKPSQASQDYPFIDGLLDEEDYEYLVDGLGYTEINLPVGQKTILRG